MTETIELSIDSKIEFVDLVASITKSVTGKMGFEEDDASWIELAVHEAVINAIIADGTDFFFGNGFFIELALAFGQADLDLRRVVRRSSRRSRFLIEAIWREMLEKQGLPPELAGDILALTLSLVRGFAMRRFIEDDPARRAHLVKVWRDMIRAYLGARLDEKRFAGIFVEPVIGDGLAATATVTTPAWLPLDDASEKPRTRKRARKRA